MQIPFIHHFKWSDQVSGGMNVDNPDDDGADEGNDQPQDEEDLQPVDRYVEHLSDVLITFFTSDDF